MIGWLRRLLGLHEHKWRTIETARIKAAKNDPDGSPRYIGNVITQECETCGLVEQRKFLI